jgi:hypothetical protein
MISRLVQAAICTWLFSLLHLHWADLPWPMFYLQRPLLLYEIGPVGPPILRRIAYLTFGVSVWGVVGRRRLNAPYILVPTSPQ